MGAGTMSCGGGGGLDFITGLLCYNFAYFFLVFSLGICNFTLGYTEFAKLFTKFYCYSHY